MTISSLSTTKAHNIERAAATARFIGGSVRSVERGPRGSWTLEVQTPHNIYPISLWDDDKPQHVKALDYRKGDIVTLQVHAYEHPVYQPWKIYDILQFDHHQFLAIQSLEQQIKQQALSCNTLLKQGEIEARQIGDYEHAYAIQQEQRNTQSFWSTVAGIGSAVGCLASAPFTGGASLFGLPAAGMLVHNGQSQTGSNAVAEVALRHRREALGRTWDTIRQQATQALALSGQLERTIGSAKLLPWKECKHGAAYGILPPQLNTELQVIANSSAPLTTTVIDVECSSFPGHLTGAKPSRELGLSKAKL
jgi:hypothetical protein